MYVPFRAFLSPTGCYSTVARSLHEGGGIQYVNSGFGGVDLHTRRRVELVDLFRIIERCDPSELGSLLAKADCYMQSHSTSPLIRSLHHLGLRSPRTVLGFMIRAGHASVQEIERMPILDARVRVCEIVASGDDDAE